jgi:hypothetical protein
MTDMTKLLLSFALLFARFAMTPMEVQAQGSDMVVLKKGPEKTIKTFTAGSQIKFITRYGSAVEGMIKVIEKDSIYIHTYDARSGYTIWGTSFWDTLSVSLSRYHISDIVELVRPSRGFGFIRNGWLFILGGLSYAILHSVNAVYLKEPIIPSTMAISGGVAATGLVMNRLHKKTVKLGHGYHLQYVPLK